MRKTLTAGVLTAVIAVAGPTTADAEERVFGSLARALEACADCHHVPGVDSVPPGKTPTAKSFQVLADDEATYSDSRLSGVLRYGHVPIRQMRLSDGEIREIVAFIRGLSD